MQIKKLIDDPQSKELILCFAGWSASPELFKKLRVKEGTNLWICYDYRQLEFFESLHQYKEIHLVAWSLGVWVASNVMRRSLVSTITQIHWTTTAINGTGKPIDDYYGIPVDVFHNTLKQLNPENLARFNRRMCGFPKNIEAYNALPARPFEEVKEELQSLYEMIKVAGEAPKFPWMHIWLSREDHIFPIMNMQLYWRDHPDKHETDTPHEPFYQWDKWETLWT